MQVQTPAAQETAMTSLHIGTICNSAGIPARKTEKRVQLQNGIRAKSIPSASQNVNLCPYPNAAACKKWSMSDSTGNCGQWGHGWVACGTGGCNQGYIPVMPGCTGLLSALRWLVPSVQGSSGGNMSYHPAPLLSQPASQRSLFFPVCF